VNIVDVVIVALVSLFAVRGYLRGLFREVFSLLGLLVGFVVASRYYEPVAQFWQGSWQFSPFLLHILSFVSLFFVTYLILNVLGLLLHRSAPFLFLGGLNRLGGVLMGAGKAAVLVGLALFVLISQNWIPESMAPSVRQATLAEPLFELGERIVDFGRAAVGPDFDPTHGRSNRPGMGYHRGSGFRQRL